MNTQVQERIAIRGIINTQYQIFATIKGNRYRVELLDNRHQNGYDIVKVRVLPNEDGFQPKPFCSRDQVYPPFVYSNEGEVLASQLEVLR